MTPPFAHIPVLLPETIDLMTPRPGGRYIDCTLGAAGHAEKLLQLSSPNGSLLGIDADPAAIRAAADRLSPWGDRVTLVNAYFDSVAAVARERGWRDVDGILFDLGVSSPQLDTAERGFSFQADAPLDMRFGPGAGTTAADLVNGLDADELQTLFSTYGEERHARRVARAVVEARAVEPIRTTGRLAHVVAGAKPRTSGERIHPATRVFQALRIATNDELGRLERALPQALQLLRTGGRLVVISFHSLEDRIVKQFIQREARGCICPPELPVCICGHQAALRPLTRKPVTAGPAELSANPRARSAKLRAAERL